MLRALRICILLYILAFVVVGTLIESLEATDWDATLQVNVYPIAGDESGHVRDFIEALSAEDFMGVEAFLDSEAARYAVALNRPVRISLASDRGIVIPEIEERASWPQIVLWSLHMRWKTMRVNWSSELPAPDITLYAVYHDPDRSPALDRSTALRKGLIAIANLFADHRHSGSNDVVMTHELLHTLGATDKYSFATLAPTYPDGYGEPERRPLHPQRYAEIMAGRVALSPDEAAMPDSLRDVRVGQTTAAEIGWIASF